MSDYLEESEIYQEKTTFVAWLVAIAVFIWFLMSIMIYWLFGFKYWVISIEVPRYLNGNAEERRLCSETMFSLINFVAFTVMFVVCGFAAYFRGK
jgi:hypothetical protein